MTRTAFILGSRMAVLGVCVWLAGCGQKGPLYLPAPPAAAPAASAPAAR